MVEIGITVIKFRMNVQLCGPRYFTKSWTQVKYAKVIDKTRLYFIRTLTQICSILQNTSYEHYVAQFISIRQQTQNRIFLLSTEKQINRLIESFKI